jgi:ABC-type oligopeptide transport system substrate-binding subunit
MDPSSNLKVWVSGSNSSENGWDDPVYDKMVAEREHDPRPSPARSRVDRGGEYICEQMPGMPMYTMVDDYLVKPI